MRSLIRAALTSLALIVVLAVTASAAIRPYVRLDYGGNELRMSDVDAAIQANQADFQAVGYAASFKKVGSAYGWNGAAGVWLLPCFRVGAMWSYQKATLSNRLHVPGSFFYADDAEMRMRELGGEAVLRFERLRGFTVGATVAQGRAQIVEGVTNESLSSQDYFDATYERTRPTFGGFVGFDQTNPDGVAGYIHAGFAYRDMGHMDGKYVESDGTTSVAGTARSNWIDYSGWYVKVGIGYDLVH
jgi:hypothetical protein